MRPVDEYQEVFDGLYFWQGYDSAVKVDLSCVALRVGSELLFIDPIPLADEPLAALTGRAKPAAIILTNGNHERAAAKYRAEFSIPVIAHAGARGEFTVPIDEWIEDEKKPLCAGLSFVHLPGAAKGEIGIHCAVYGGLMVIGDALINLDQTGFTFLPEKYCDDPKLAKESLRKLLAFEFEAMTFAHGAPMISGARRRLEQLLH